MTSLNRLLQLKPFFIHLSQMHAFPVNTHHQLLIQPDKLRWSNVLLMVLKFERKAFKVIRFQEWCVSSRCCRRYRDISARGQSSFKFSCLPLHAINRNCSAPPKMDVSEIVVGEPAANFTRRLMKRSAWQLVYFNCSMTPNNGVCGDKVLQDQVPACQWAYVCSCTIWNFPFYLFL